MIHNTPFLVSCGSRLRQERVTPEEVLALAERTEVDVEGGLSPRPLMSVPHPLSGESCCYYHGAVQQALAALLDMADWDLQSEESLWLAWLTALSQRNPL